MTKTDELGFYNRVGVRKWLLDTGLRPRSRSLQRKGVREIHPHVVWNYFEDRPGHMVAKRLHNGNTFFNARRLAALLAEAGLRVDPPPEEVETNIVFAEVPEATMDAAAFVSGLGQKGVVVNAPRGRRVRFMTHPDVSADDIEFAAASVRDVLGVGATTTPAS